MIEAGGDTEVEIRVGSTSGFTLELWNYAPQVMSVGIVSPSGEYSGKTFARYGERRRVNFILEITYRQPHIKKCTSPCFIKNPYLPYSFRR